MRLDIVCHARLLQGSPREPPRARLGPTRVRITALITESLVASNYPYEYDTAVIIKCELDSLHASEAWDEGLEWESYQFGRTVFSTSAGWRSNVSTLNSSPANCHSHALAWGLAVDKLYATVVDRQPNSRQARAAQGRPAAREPPRAPESPTRPDSSKDYSADYSNP